MSRSAAPERTLPVDRIPFIDRLRGIAVLGILVMNIQAFARLELAYLSPPFSGPLSGPDRWVHALGYLFVEQVFIGLFAMLFGISSWIIRSNARAAGACARRRHLGRNVVLLGIGLVHAYLIWSGDILVSYALAALLLTPCLDWPARRQLKLGLLCLAVPALLSLVQFALVDAGARAGAFSTDAATLAAEIEARRGGWAENQAWRVATSLEAHLWSLPFWNLWFAAGWMLVGMVLLRSGIARATWSLGFYIRWTLAWLVAGLVVKLLAYGYQSQAEFDLATVALGRGVLSYLGALGLTLGYLGVAVLAYRLDWLPRLSALLEGIGRLALSNYLLQSLVATWLFQGFGFGLFERLSLTALVPVTLAIWVLNAGFSRLWLHCFARGPAEWLWRSLARRVR